MVKRTRRIPVSFGGFRAYKSNAPSAFSDMYYSALELSWPAFFGLFVLVFLAINAFFGVIYAAIPNAIANAHPHSFLDGFFFSVETLATVGYGNMAPIRYAAHTVATVEIMLGVLLTATVTGLTFARFARPRSSILFSNVAILGLHDGKEALIVRIASVRARPLADVSAQFGFVEQVDVEDGPSFRQVVDLPLVRQHNAMLTLSWTLTHIIDPDGPVRETLRNGEPVRLMVTVGGLDTLLASPTFGGRFYRNEDIRIDHDFVDMIDEDEGGVLDIDLGRLHQTKAREAAPAQR